MEYRGRASSADVRFGRMVRAVLDLRGVRQHALAAAIGVSPQTLNGKMNGRSTWTLTEAHTVAHILGVPLGVLEMDPAEALAELAEHHAA